MLLMANVNPIRFDGKMQLRTDPMFRANLALIAHDRGGGESQVLRDLAAEEADRIRAKKKPPAKRTA